MQMGSSALLALCLYLVGYTQRKKAPVLLYLCCGLASIYVLFIGLYLLHLHMVASGAYYVGYVAFCSLLWLLTGLLGRMGMYQLCGWLGLLCVYGWMLARQLADLSQLALEISWVPVSLIFIWIGWLVHHKNKQSAGVLLAVGSLVFLAPEVIGLLMPLDSVLVSVQGVLVGKLLLAGAVLFALRKKWIEWVV